MPEPLQFPSVTPRHSLPLLFSGQTQKEAFVNAALGLCDALLQPAVEGEANVPPAAPANGENWLVGPGAAGEFAGREGHLASRQCGGWIFCAPRDGMRVHDRATGQLVLFADGWRREAPIAPPVGGAVVDSEAREVIGQLLEAIARVGVLPQN